MADLDRHKRTANEHLAMFTAATKHTPDIQQFMATVWQQGTPYNSTAAMLANIHDMQLDPQTYSTKSTSILVESIQILCHEIIDMCTAFVVRHVLSVRELLHNSQLSWRRRGSTSTSCRTWEVTTWRFAWVGQRRKVFASFALLSLQGRALAVRNLLSQWAIIAKVQWSAKSGSITCCLALE